MRDTLRRPVVALLSGALVLTTSGACVTTSDFEHGERRPAMAGGSFVEVTFHARAFRKDQPARVDWRLYQRAGKGRVLVHDGVEAAWLSPPLDAGKYEIEVQGWTKADGKRVAREEPLTKRFKVGPDELVTADFVLEDYRPQITAGLVAVLVGGLVWTVVQISKWNAWR